MAEMCLGGLLILGLLSLFLGIAANGFAKSSGPVVSLPPTPAQMKKAFSEAGTQRARSRNAVILPKREPSDLDGCGWDGQCQ
jgi:hypothetical protein